MSASTGPILAAGGITLFNAVIINNQSVQTQAKVIVGTGIAAMGLALIEHASYGLAVGLAWLTLITTLFVRVTPNVPAPLESFTKWYNS